MSDVALIGLKKLELWSSRPEQNGKHQIDFCMSETIKNRPIVSYIDSYPRGKYHEIKDCSRRI